MLLDRLHLFKSTLLIDPADPLHFPSPTCRDNPYHNRKHATDVLQTLHVLLTRGGLVPHYTDPILCLACYLSAVVHDIEHVGLNNDVSGFAFSLFVASQLLLYTHTHTI